MIRNGTTSFEEKRDSPRHLLPKGTTVLFKRGEQPLATAYARDLSETGMLICDYFPSKRYRLDSVINDIFMNMPENQNSEETRINSRTSLFIAQGKVVRCFPDEIPNMTCYGISFLNKNVQIKNRINELVRCFSKF